MKEKKKLNFIFWGTPEVASETLEILKQSGYLPSLIITAPDRPKGRKMLLTPTPVKVWAEENNIPYMQPENLKEEKDRPSPSGKAGPFPEKFGEAELNIVVAYGKIMPEEILNFPKYGSINVHYSLLPKYRGASPVESAILNGDNETGVSIQKMEYKMDAGPIIAEEKTKIGASERAPELRERLIKIGGNLLVKVLPEFLEGKIKPIPQEESKATYCKKIKKEDGLIDLGDDPVKNYNKFRAYAEWPRTFFFREKKRIIVTDAKLEDGKFVIKKIIPEGGKETEYRN